MTLHQLLNSRLVPFPSVVNRATINMDVQIDAFVEAIPLDSCSEGL